MRSTPREIIYLIILNLLYFISLLFIRHAWIISELSDERVQEIYPRLYYMFVSMRGRCVLIFTILSVIIVLTNIVLIFKVISIYRDKKTAAIFFISIAIALTLGEVGLRISGYKPGMKKLPAYFKPVEKLWEYKGFYADENGILKIDSTVGKEISQRIASNISTTRKNETNEIYYLADDYIGLLNGTIKNNLSNLYISIKQKSENNRTDFEESVIDYIHNPINKDGFRSIPFKKYKHNKPSILLLGDSFTWGHSTRNITSSFADILLSKGYVVYNTGITATDVAQYMSVAEKYIPVLKPDFVVVNFYIGNDITYYRREILPHKPVFYCSNAGNLLSCPHGVYLTMEEAYRLTLSYYTIPVNESNIDKYLLSTSLGTHLINMLIRSNLFPYYSSGINNLIENYYKEVKKNEHELPYSNEELLVIKNIADKHNVQFILSSIPEFYYSSKKTIKNFPELFGGLEYKEIEVNSSDYRLSNGHFNDQGHAKYADFLEQIILTGK